MKLLSRAEEIVLLIILKLKDDAYGVKIREEIYKDTGTRWSYGSIYMPLNKLARKQYVVKQYGEPTAERGGRRKCIYQVTEKGLEALREIYKVNNNVWSNLPENILREGTGK